MRHYYRKNINVWDILAGGISLDAVSRAGSYLDEVTYKWKLSGNSSSQMIIGLRNKLNEVV